MSYNRGYNQNSTQGYGQANPNEYGEYGPYGQAPSYDQGRNNYAADNYNSPPQNYSQQTGYGQQAGYGQQPVSGQQRPGMQHQSSSQYDEERVQGGYEMGQMNDRSNDPNRILNEVRDMDRALDHVDQVQSRLQVVMGKLVRAFEAEPLASLTKERDMMTTELQDTISALKQRLEAILARPESGNPRNSAQLGKLSRRIAATHTLAMQTLSKCQKDKEELFIRQYKITCPGASEAEIQQAAQAAAEDEGTTQVFSQSLMNGPRGQIQAVLDRNRERLDDWKKIERTMLQICAMTEQLTAMIDQQNAQIIAIEQKAEEVVDHVQHANTELTVAVDKSKAARKKKFICAGIVVLIIIIIVVVVVVVVLVTRPPSTSTGTTQRIMM